MAGTAAAPNPNIEYAADTRVGASAADLSAWTLEMPAGAVIAIGPCPACSHPVSTAIVTDVLADTGVKASAVPPERRMTRRFPCNCTPDHKGRPSAAKGCGRWWLAAVQRNDDGTSRIIEAPDETLVYAASALDQAAQDEVTAVRASTEKWLPAVTALYGLFGLAGVVVGKDTLDKIAIEGRIVIAVLIVAGLISTLVALYWGYRAAFGWFTVRDVSDDDKLAAWFRQRREAIIGAPRNLRTALTAAASALTLLLLAVGVLWFWPPSDPPSPVVEVSYLAGGVAGQDAKACGPLKSGEGQTFVIQATDGSQKVPVTIDVAWVTAITPKTSC